MQELLERKKGLHRKILIVDDEFIEREMLGHMLDDMYEVAYAENGAEAADIIRREKNTLSLVILDLHMPVLDGYSLLEIMRSDTDLRRIPAIVLTSEKDAEVRSLHLGAADFITKPYEVPDVVRARVRHAIELAEDTIIIHETERDELTGLFNKQFFFKYGKRLDEQNGFMPMDALVIDINRFHLVNELYGRNYGDKLLQQIGGSLHELVSRTGGLACRSGSNSFCVYLPHSDMLRESLPKHIAKLDEMTGDCVCVTAKGKPVKPKTLGQKKYIEAIKNNTITLGVGPAGTGKTYLAVAMAVTAFRAKEVNRIILTRPAVEAGERLGFLPGDLQQKVDPYLRPLYDALFDMLGAESFQKYQERGSIEVAPLAYMRGRTLDDSFIILDEAQNTTKEQMKMFLTRLGFNSKMVVTGDITQIDLPDGKKSGLMQAMKILRNIP
ncbi:MAG: PhoH family protein, partial [Ruminococcus sp.]|nr:PhoH family protein [Ruminococcus sp.]